MTATETDSRRFRLGTRGLRLALTQSGQVVEALMTAGGGGAAAAAGKASEGPDSPGIDPVTIRTDGDGDRTPLRQLGGVGVFAARLRHALLNGEVDLVVHSFKDLLMQPVEGLEVICVPPHEDPRNTLCARDSLTLTGLPEGARVGTGSPRRAAQLLAACPDPGVVDLRGNVPTRLARVWGLGVAGVGTDEPVASNRVDVAGDLDAVVLALSGLRRLALEHCVSEVLDLKTMLPAPVQGVLVVETRADEDSAELARAVATLDDEPACLAVTAERALMARLGAGCAAPVGAWAHLRDDSQVPRVLVLRAVVTSLDGGQEVGCKLSAELSEASDGSGAPGDMAAVRAAEMLGTRAAEVLLDDSADQIVNLHANKPQRH